MRTTSHRAAAWAALVAVAALGLVTEPAQAQNGYITYSGGAMLVAGTDSGAQAGCPGGPTTPGPACGPCAGQAPFAQGCRPPCGSCGSCGHCAGPHRQRTLMETDYWDGRRMCGQCPYGIDHCGRCSDPKWEVTGGVLFMSRSDARKGILVGDTMGQSRVSTSDLDLDWPVGPRVTAVRRFENFDFEFIYWHIDDWDSDHLVVGNFDLIVPLGGLDPYFFDAVHVDYLTRLYNVESNMKIRWGEAVNVIVGSRVMELHERFSLDADGGAQGPLDANLQAKTANFLYGFQLGLDTDVPAWFGIKFNIFMKAGVFVNHLRESWSRTTSLFGTEGGSFSDTETAFVGETGAMATWQFNKNLGLFAGYKWMFIDGVVLAPDMLTQTTVRTNTPNYEGAMCGANLQW